MALMPNPFVSATIQQEFGTPDTKGRILGTSDGDGGSDAIVFLGNGNGTFESPIFFALHTPPKSWF
jgi:hypothetical protein